jgi:tetratricopeptide (TPR) repeat protein
MARPRRTEFRPRLADHRARTSLTQEGVAHRLTQLAYDGEGVSLPATAHIVARHERGAQYPSAVYRRQYVRLYQASEAELGLVLTPRSAVPLPTEGSVPRRGVLRAGTAAISGILGVPPAADGIPADLVRTLTTQEPAPVSEEVADLDALTRRVVRLKLRYQTCQYRAAVAELPGTLHAARSIHRVTDGVARDRADELIAGIYQVAVGVLLKLGDAALAAVAADRAMAAAANSGSPVSVASSARAVAHSLIAGGHALQAVEICTSAAEHLDTQVSGHDRQSLSIYGALLLRAAAASAERGDGAGATGLLDEAAGAARRLGRDGNAGGTAFGPTNVLLHRVHVALALGDAGTALRQAQRVDLSCLPVAERKAALYVDAARAMAQWERYEPALEAVRAADRIAPEEVRSRPAVHSLLSDIADRSPNRVAKRVHAFMIGIGCVS